jgi:hypothetical protein
MQLQRSMRPLHVAVSSVCHEHPANMSLAEELSFIA